MPPEIVQFGRYQLVKKIATGGMAEISSPSSKVQGDSSEAW